MEAGAGVVWVLLQAAPPRARGPSRAHRRRPHLCPETGRFPCPRCRTGVTTRQGLLTVVCGAAFSWARAPEQQRP